MYASHVVSLETGKRRSLEEQLKEKSGRYAVHRFS